MHSLRSSVVGAVSLFLIGCVDASCYYPDGSFPSNYAYVPCSGDQFTSCCIMSEGDQCLSNGLCYYPGGQYMFRGACSDKNWNSPNCFNHCTNKTNSYFATYDRIIKCGGDRYCCNSDGTACCNDDSKVFTLGNVSVIKDLATTTRKTGGFQALVASPTSTTTQSNAATSARPISTGSSPSDSAAPNASPATGASNPTSTSTDTGTTSAVTTSHTFSKTTIIAASAAATLLLIALLAITSLLIRRHYRKKLSHNNNNNNNNNNTTNATPFNNNNHNKEDMYHSYPMSPTPGSQTLNESKTPVYSGLIPAHNPPPYQSPTVNNSNGVYQSPVMAHPHPPAGAMHGAVEMDAGGTVPTRDRFGQPVYEAPGGGRYI